MWILHRPDFQFSFPIIELFLSSEKGVVLLQDEEEDLRKYWTHLSCFSNVRRKNVKRSLLRFSKSCLDFLVLELQGVKSWDLEPFSLFSGQCERECKSIFLILEKFLLRELWAGCKKRRWRWSSSGRKSAAWTLKMELSACRQEMVWNQKKATYGHRPQKSCMKADISIWCYETRRARLFYDFSSMFSLWREIYLSWVIYEAILMFALSHPFRRSLFGASTWLTLKKQDGNSLFLHTETLFK